MKLYVKYNMNALCKRVLTEQLDKLSFNYTLIGFTEIEVKEVLTAEKWNELSLCLDCYGIEVVESHKSILVQKIKDAIIEMIYIEEQLPTSKISDHLAEKLLHSYGYLANLFSEVTFTSIENFIILQKIERAKHFISINELTFTEISFRLNYSSLAHFSTQFKNTTGLTPSAFQRIIKKRRQA